MIIKARHHPVVYPFFKRYTTWKIRKHFYRVIIRGKYHHLPGSLLVLSNHFSWWDGFWIHYLNLKIFHRKIHFMMLEEQLRKYWFFRYTGGFSVRKGTRSVSESIDYSAEILRNSRNMLFMFPQGKHESLYTSNFLFEKGVEKILHQTIYPVHILLVANLVEYHSEPRPSVYMYFTEYAENDFSTGALQAAYNRFFDECLREQKERSNGL